MARAVEAAWPGELSGLIVTRHGHGAPTSRIEVVDAAHPVPDAAGEAASRRITGPTLTNVNDFRAILIV